MTHTTTTTETFLRQMYGDSEGFAILTIITGDSTREKVFEYPRQAPEIAAAAVELAPGADVYYCTTLRSTASRKLAESEPVGAVWLHVDVDHGMLEAVADALEEFDAYVVGSGTPGNGHVYVKVSEPLSANHFKQLSSGLHSRFEEVAGTKFDSKIASNDILRIPGTLNHKTDQPTDVVVLREWNGYEYDADDLADKLGVILTDDSYSPNVTGAEPVRLTEGPMHADVSSRLGNAISDLYGPSRYEHTRDNVIALVSLAEKGYPGVQDAVDSLRRGYVAALKAERPNAAVEFDRLLHGAQSKVSQSPASESARYDASSIAAVDFDLIAGDIESVPVVASAEVAGTHVRRASEMAPPRRQEWLAEKRIPKDKVTLLVGNEGIGKSAWWVWLVAKLTTGTPAPEFGITSTTPKEVVLVITEDSWSMDVLPRLMAAGADISRIRVVSDTDDGEGSPIFPTNLDYLPEDADLVIVDAWLDTLPANLSVKDAQQARRALHPLKEWCGTTGTAMLLVTHLNRLSTGNVRDAYGASGELRKAARSTLLAQREQGTEDVLLVGTDKSNGARVGVASRFQTFGVAVAIEGEDADIVSVRYIGQANATAAQIFQDAHAAGDDGGESRDCVTWLREFLTIGNGSAEAKVVMAAAKAELYSDRAIGNAKRTLRVESMKAPGVNNGPWLWVLPGA